MEAYKAFVCVCLVLHTVAPCVVAQIQLVPALYVFGDSTVDAGNNNYLKTIIKANFPPYGRDFDTHVATGRFCNGRTPADWLSAQLGLPLVPAYLDPAAQGSAIVKGVNFATSASGLYWKTAATFNVPPLETQVEWFKEYKERLEGTVGEQNASSVISQALFALSTGSNDYVNNYYINPITQKEFDKDTYRGVLMDSFSEFVQKLYGLGARRIAVVGLTPLGCVPSQVTLYGQGVLKCIEFENEDALLFNRALNSTVRSLRGTLSDLKLAYLDVYPLFSDVFSQPSKYGFEKTLTGCCGTGRLEVAILCNPKIGACPDATKYVFWDSFHPTDTMNKLIARAALTQEYSAAYSLRASEAQAMAFLAQRRLLSKLGRSWIGQESTAIRDYHSAPPTYTNQTDGLNQAAGGERSEHYIPPKKFGPQRPILTTVSSRWKFKMAAEKLFRDAAAKNAPPGEEPPAADVTTISITPPPYVKTKKLGKTAAFIMEILNKEAVAEVRKEREIPELKPGYIVRLKVEIPENKRRIQEYKGIIIAMRNNGIHTTFRIRRQIGGAYVENVLPLYSPLIKEFEILDRKKVRRAKLYYLRDGDHKLKSIKVKKKAKQPQGFNLPPASDSKRS